MTNTLKSVNRNQLCRKVRIHVFFKNNQLLNLIRQFRGTCNTCNAACLVGKYQYWPASVVEPGTVENSASYFYTMPLSSRSIIFFTIIGEWVLVKV